MTTDEATRRELDQLTGWLSRMETRIEGIDQGGTRGMGAVLVQISELAKDLGEVRGEQRAWERGHDQAHDADESRRVTGRRWLITLGVTNAVAVLGPWLAVLVNRHLAAQRSGARPSPNPGQAPPPSSRPAAYPGAFLFLTATGYCGQPHRSLHSVPAG